ncbi:MAG: citrate synthase [Micropruina sp.]|uniref:citrate synthase n=1 Tax=Micropruina sp. TaxID=2737536 RepID=UPI0039E36292
MSEMTAQEVAARLGVKLDTVYAYVSRGVLSARRQPSSRRSVFDPQDVEALARRGRPRRTSRPSALDLVVETGLTTIIDQRIRYRGRDACGMARTHSFEEVAEWLWTGGDDESVPGWEPYPMSLPAELESARDRMRAAVVLGSAAEPLRSGLSTPAVATSARRLIASMALAVPAAPDARVARLALAGRPQIRGSIAGRLWGRLAGGRSTPGLVAGLNAALVLLADHELASSTVTARVAASVRADPFSVVLAGLGSIAGPLHAGASALVHRMIEDASTGDSDKALAAALETYRHLPGFGHRLYPDGDPRATVLLDMLTAAAPGARHLRAARALVDAAYRHSRTRPNIDFALGALSTTAQMPPTAGETIFTIARAAGWVAHAIEEYAEPPVRFRARAISKPSGSVTASH